MKLEGGGRMWNWLYWVPLTTAKGWRTTSKKGSKHNAIAVTYIQGKSGQKWVRKARMGGPITHNVLVNAFVRVFFEVFERMLRYITHRKEKYGKRLLQPVFDVVTKRRKKNLCLTLDQVLWGLFINDAKYNISFEDSRTFWASKSFPLWIQAIMQVVWPPTSTEERSWISSFRRTLEKKNTSHVIVWHSNISYD